MRHGLQLSRAAQIFTACILAVGLCVGLEPLSCQTDGSVIGVGPTFTLTRPGDRPLWGIGGRWQSSPKLGLVYRARGSFQFARKGPEPYPLLATAGLDLGVRSGKGLDAISFTLGPTLFYYPSGRKIDPNCASFRPCRPINRGYDLGFLLMVTATLGFELSLGERTSAFLDYTMHVPSRIGRNGFASDPTAAVLGLSCGLAFQR